jgi:ABC-type sulfate transport system permease component
MIRVAYSVHFVNDNLLNNAILQALENGGEGEVCVLVGIFLALLFIIAPFSVRTCKKVGFQC